MQGRCFSPIVAVIAGLAAIWTATPAGAWSDIAESESKILVNGARLGMVRTQTKVDGGRNTRMEYAVMVAKGNESWLSVFVNEAHPGTYFRNTDTDPKQASKLFSVFDKNAPAFEREGKNGGVRHIVARLAEREYVVITRHGGVTGTDANSADGTTLIILMNYCLPPGTVASNEHVTAAVSSVGIKGIFDPKWLWHFRAGGLLGFPVEKPKT
jgi:hypothetical protein